MFGNFVNSFKKLIQDNKKDNEQDKIKRQVSLQTAKKQQTQTTHKIFDQQNDIFSIQQRDRIINSSLNRILPKSVLQQQQFYKFYYQLNFDILPQDKLISGNINTKLLKENLDVLKQLKSIVDQQQQPPVKQQMYYSQQELSVILRSNEINVVNFVFRKYKGIIENKGVVENKFFIQEQLHAVRLYLHDEMLQKKDEYDKLVLLINKQNEPLFQRLDMTYLLLRKTRNKLNQRKKDLQIIYNIQRKNATKKRMIEMITMFSRIQIKFGQIVSGLQFHFQIQTSQQNYKSLVISALYCIQKFRSGFYYQFIKSLFRRIEDKIVYLKHKLKSNLFHIIRLLSTNKTNDDMNQLQIIVNQFINIELVAQKYYKSNKHNDFRKFFGTLREDQQIFMMFFQEIEQKAPQFFQDRLVKEKILSIYYQNKRHN